MTIREPRTLTVLPLALLLAALALLAVPATGHAQGLAETRVTASTSAAPTVTGVFTPLAAISQLGQAGGYDATASGSLLAAEAGTANEGIYVINTARGTYVGQSGDITARFSQHLIENGGRFTQAELDAADRIGVTGGKTAREIAEQQEIDELGGIDSLLNIRNPIGARRQNLMPQPDSRP